MAYRKQIHSTFSHVEVLSQLEAQEISKAKNIIETTGIIPAHLGFSMRIVMIAYNRIFQDEIS
jgi:hypothetical protein